MRSNQYKGQYKPKNKPASKAGNNRAVRDILKSIFKDYKLTDKLNETMMRTQWEAMVGKGIATYTDDIKYAKGHLQLVCKSAPMREELRFAKEKLRTRINEEMGEELVLEISIL
ncbi:MAG: putative nucleic acid-binding Zn ribbon protein [Limisphaerales bacterium]|jgi:predicted nucleic acid-binding Zn ribbon protein